MLMKRKYNEVTHNSKEKNCRTDTQVKKVIAEYML